MNFNGQTLRAKRMGIRYNTIITVKIKDDEAIITRTLRYDPDTKRDYYKEKLVQSIGLFYNEFNIKGKRVLALNDFPVYMKHKERYLFKIKEVR